MAEVAGYPTFNLLYRGLIVFLVSLFGYHTWTKPPRTRRPSGYALGTVRGTQFGMAIGTAAMVIGVIGLLVHLIQRV